MESLQTQHKELLEAQLASLRQEFLSQSSADLPTDHTHEPISNQTQTQEQEEVQTTIKGLTIINVPIQPEHEDLGEQLVEFRTSQDSESVPALPTAELIYSQEVEVKEEIPLVNRKRCSEGHCAGTSQSKVQRVS